MDFRLLHFLAISLISYKHTKNVDIKKQFHLLMLPSNILIFFTCAFIVLINASLN
jgi:hypothetical protein